jgi:hypothetical protein
MATFDASSAECLIFTFKEGLLSAVAHDLKLRVERFEVSVDPDSVSARFEAASIRVVCARKHGADAPGTLSDKDRREIEANLEKDVLAARKFAEIRFTSTRVEPAPDGYRVAGTLSLHGRERPLTVAVRREGERLVADVTLHQPDYGIKPYSAMLGTLKIKPDVQVRLSLPASATGT